MQPDEPRLTKNERKELKRQRKLEQRSREERQHFLTKMATYTVIGLVMVLIGYAIYNSIVPIPAAEKNLPVNRALEGEWVKGNANAPVTIVEYSDFQCPSCREVSPVMEALLQQYPDTVALVYRHFPLRQIHPQANLAAQAAEAAGTQGKFWEMHDLLFQNQETWAENRRARSLFGDYARELGLDLNRFNQDLGSKEVRGRVKADYTSAIQQALNSTPSFFVNGELVVNPRGVADFAQVIEAKLQEATASGQPQP